MDKTPDLRDAVANLFRHLAKFCQGYIHSCVESIRLTQVNRLQDSCFSSLTS